MACLQAPQVEFFMKTRMQLIHPRQRHFSSHLQLFVVHQMIYSVSSQQVPLISRHSVNIFIFLAFPSTVSSECNISYKTEQPVLPRGFTVLLKDTSKRTYACCHGGLNLGSSSWRSTHLIIAYTVNPYQCRIRTGDQHEICNLTTDRWERAQQRNMWKGKVNVALMMFEVGQRLYCVTLS